MALRSEKDRAKAQQEKLQAILSSLLKDEDNKYCEDCDAKGPRWASWNLGVFLCIRCAGIHRNLGVHISRVKSVNLDTWTPEQIVMMQEMGNSRARAVYEANIQDSFRRPQTDSALEAFIRAKYEHKKYIAKEWVPPKPVVPKEFKVEWLEDDKAEKKKVRNKPTSNISLSSGPPPSQSSVSTSSSSEGKTSTKPSSSLASEPKPAEPQAAKSKSGTDDLLGLDFAFNQTPNADVPQNYGGGGQGGDLLADIFGGSSAPQANQSQGPQQNFMTTQQNGAAEENLFESGTNGNAEGQGEKKSAKDSIMALFGSGGGQQQMFGVPGGMYMPQQQVFGAGGMQPMVQQQQQQQQGMMGMQPGMRQPMQQGMMGMQQQPGAMFGNAGQMGQNQMGNNMMGAGQGNMMARPGGQMFMQQPQQQMNPMQQQMHYQQMQQQMANMSMGGGQMGGMQQPQHASVGGGSWAGAGTGQTLSTNLWQ